MSTTPAEFDGMRPLEACELPAAYDQLLADEMFCKVLGFVFPGVPLEAIAAKMRSCKTSLEFQIAFCKPFLEGIVTRYSDGLSSDLTAAGPTPDCQNYTYITNHRDIVLDSGLLDLLLVNEGLSTVEIAIGDNLLIYPWIRTLVRANRSFIVTRSGGIHDILNASRQLSGYIHYTVGEKKSSVWIAQREGRSKDSMDETQDSLLKMLVIAGEGSLKERMRSINLTPLAISYEYDPCDFLKAQEFQLKRDIEGFHKSPADDLASMKTGIFGSKGRIHYQAAPCINAFLDTLPDDMTKAEFFPTVARYIDHCIYRNYRLFPGNYVALDLLQGTDDLRARYTAEEKATFCQYLDGQLAKIQIDNKDNDFLRGKMLEMYANPARHQLMLNK